RANQQAKELAAVTECLVVFQGPQHYISPSLYATKRETGKVVPTWNYITVQAYGAPKVVDDAAWLRQQIDDLTRHQEGSRAAPWHVADAPDDFIAAQVKGIVGLEIPILRIDGKWKVSQNRPAADQAGVAAGLRGLSDNADAMADALIARGKIS
ncbi:MAG: FMN-binding negative transcriptional regulator, partial [Proteobacteria bacterium]|nr:FMN-binding negative transcriptional regulator [Pseudomonadota bacterium]